MSSSLPQQPDFLRVAIVGGGITGLAAAYRLRELMPQAAVTLFEAGPRLGGVLDTVQRGEFLIERSADSFQTRLPQAVDLCRRLGIDSELQSTDASRRRAYIVRDGRLVAVPTGFVLMSPRKLLPLLKSPVLSFAGKLRVLIEPLIPRRRPATNPTGQGSEPADESVASFARRRLGNEAFEWLVQPLVSGIYTSDPEKLSMAATMPEFLAEERDQGSLRAAARRAGYGANQVDYAASGARYSLFVAPRDGMSGVINALAAHLPPQAIVLNSRIESIDSVTNNGWLLHAQHGAAGLPTSPGEQCFNALILATPAYVTGSLLQRIDPPLAAELSAIEYAGSAVVCLGFDRRQIGHPLDGFGFVVPQVERRRIIAASFASQKFSGRAAADTVLIRVFIGGALQPELLQLSDIELERLAVDELRALLDISGDPRLSNVARWPRSMPQYHVGHVARVARIDQLVSQHPTLAVAGNAYRGVGIPQCVASGEAAAERVAATLSSAVIER